MFQPNSPPQGAPRWYSLFDVYQDGRIALLADNQAVRHPPGIYPAPRNGGQDMYFEAVTLHGARTIDTYIVVWSRHRLDTQGFSMVFPGSGPVQREPAYTLDRFLYWLEDQTLEGMSIATVAIEP